MPNSMFNQMGFSKKDFIELSKSMINLDYSFKLKDIDCPTLIICGEKDKANKKASLELSELITDAKLKIIENSGHEVNTDNPKDLADIINSFYI